METFLPLREIYSNWKDRRKRMLVPLFPGYMFVRINPRDKFEVLNTKGVVSILGHNGTPVSVPEREIEATSRILKTGLKYRLFPYNSEGKEAVIKRGPLQGVTGRILSVRGDFRLILSVHLIKRSLSVEVDIEDVELN